MTRRLLGLSVGLAFVVFAAPATARASALVFNGATPADNATTRAAWLASIGITEPEFLVDFESGFTAGQNVSGVTGLFPTGLVITDTGGANIALIVTSPGSIGGSNPVGTFALRHNETAYLDLDFSANPIDYLGFQDIDQLGTNGIITFVGGATQAFNFETTGTGGDSAEFIGIFSNNMPHIVKVQLDASGDGSWGIDNLEYGTVPEPATMTLLGGGLLAARWARRRVRIDRHSNNQN